MPLLMMKLCSNELMQCCCVRSGVVLWIPRFFLLRVKVAASAVAAIISRDQQVVLAHLVYCLHRKPQQKQRIHSASLT